jgi:four helix bundle protein
VVVGSFGRHLDIALGSLAETSCLLRLASDVGVLTASEWQTLEDLRKRAGGLTWRLARSLNQ